MNHLQYTFQDSFEKYGLWWLPNEPNNQIGGRLTYHPTDGIRLELTGSFRDTPGNERFETDIIQGVTSDGIECTLCENGAIKEGFSVPGFFYQSFRSRYLFLGHYFDAVADLRFEAYEVNYRYLEEWIDESPYRFDWSHNDQQQHECRVIWPVGVLVDAPLPIAGGKLSVVTDYHQDEVTASSLRIRSDAYLKWELPCIEHFEQHMRIAFNLQHLVTLLIGQSTYPQRVHGYVKREGGNGAKDWLVAVFYGLPSTAPLFPKLYQHEMLLPFSLVSEHISTLVDKWLVNAEKLSSVYDLFFSSLSKSDMYLENRFLNLMHSLESYHRAMAGGQYVSSEEYRAYYRGLHDYIKASIREENLRTALGDKLKYGNEYSLRRRLKEIMRNLGDDLGPLVAVQHNDFIDTVVRVRNDLVHQGKTTLMNDQEMFYASQRLRLLLTIVLLQTLGLDNAVIGEAIRRNRRLQPWDGKG